MKHLLTLPLLLLALLVPATALAHDFEVDGIYYNINGSEVTVTYKGQFYHSYSNEYTGDITIPATVNYYGTLYTVTTIGKSAFDGCSEVTSVIIPNSVTYIDNAAFYDCSNLSNMIIPNSVTFIGNAAFTNTAWYNNQPDGLIYAGMVAYKYKGTMPDNTDIILRDGTTGIASSAFTSCSGLTSITIPNSVFYIGNYAFSNCI